MINQNGSQCIAHHVNCCSEAISENGKKKFDVQLKQCFELHSKGTHNNQSILIIMLMSSAGNPTVSNTMTIVTKPADGMPAAPIEAAVAVTLYE